MENDNNGLPTTYKAEVNIFNGASLLQLSKEESESLTASFDEKFIEIRPDGLIYLPQVFWRERLNKVIGIGQWALIIKGQHQDPDPKKDKLYLDGILMIRGSYIANAIGEAELHSNNSLQSWASVWESAKSDCITRCCKDLGIANELWQPQFIKSWIDKYAIEVWCEVKQKDGSLKNKKQFRKKGSLPFWNEKQNNKKNEDVPPVYPKQEKETTHHLNKRSPLFEEDAEAIRLWTLKINECTSISELQKIFAEGKAIINSTPELYKLKENKKKELSINQPA